AAAVTIGGRVLTANGRGISRAKLVLTNQFGEARQALTNSFGYYRFEGVAAGETYVLSVSAKTHTFSQPTIVLSVLDEIAEMNFVSEQVRDVAGAMK
ncbi:MAG TPA: carboxypeptidase-like regulatory domain-containing protein, partial [Pyrinomonadaceae bacterium]